MRKKDPTTPSVDDKTRDAAQPQTRGRTAAESNAIDAPPPSLDSFVCWSPSEETSPIIVKARGPFEAAKIFALRGMAAMSHHDNTWSPEQVLVVGYHDGDVAWVSVKVTVEVGS